LTPYARNPRTHSKKQIKQIAAAITEFGWTNPILLDASGGIIAGHARLEAAKLLGLDTVPTISIDHLTEPQKRAYIIADNKLAENAGWDSELLAIELRCLLKLEFDVELTGFEMGELDMLFRADNSAEQEPPPPPDRNTPAISQIGDLWSLGDHRLLCGDALDGACYARLMDERAQMAFADPPYNVPIDGHVSGLGATQHREFSMAVGEMSSDEFTAFLATVMRHMAAHSADGSLHYLCQDWRHMLELLTAGDGVYTELKNICVWAKTNGAMGSFYRSQHEMVAVFKHGTGRHINNVDLGRHGRNRTNVWTYPGMNTFGANRMAELAMHPTVKPVALVADAILDASKRGGIVLDPFSGSGTTIMAAEQVGRRGFAMEIDPLYVDTAIRRWQRHTGGSAVHAATGIRFDDAAQDSIPSPQETLDG
jgi:16S rRNA G966 N2-methylase RsmD